VNRVGVDGRDEGRDLICEETLTSALEKALKHSTVS
jgi:hypothetical protein